MRHEPKQIKSPFRKPWGAPSGGRGGVGGAGWEQGGGVGRENMKGMEGGRWEERVKKILTRGFYSW